jgi:hypothetical protein
MVGRAVPCTPKVRRPREWSPYHDASYLSRQTRDERVQEALDFLGIV